MQAGEDRVRTWLARPAERLVLEGCRRLTSPQGGWEPALELYRDLMGGKAGEAVLVELVRFLAVLGPCARCPLKAFPAGSNHLTRDEALIMALVAAIQHGDEQVAETCLSSLACANRCREVEAAAASFAIVLRSFGQRLTPIPLPAVEDILVRSRSVTLH